jgi:hypothetical protein
LLFRGAGTVDGNSVDAAGEEVLMHHVHVARLLCKHQHGGCSLLQALSEPREFVLCLDILHLLHNTITGSHTIDNSQFSHPQPPDGLMDRSSLQCQ